jgi:hypothetical protein
LTPPVWDISTGCSLLAEHAEFSLGLSETRPSGRLSLQ